MEGTGIHWLWRVTPGRSSAFARLLPAKVLMKVDFPTLVIPTTMARMGFFIPFAA